MPDDQDAPGDRRAGGSDERGDAARGRFFLGVGTGENLNEHVLGDRWPPTFVRREMLREAVEVMRELWQGG